MRILRHLTASDERLEPFPFRRELSMESYLVENSNVLALDDETFRDVEVVEEELTLKEGRYSKETDGRIDILIRYSDEYVGVVELKLGELEERHLAQLEDYLRAPDKILGQHREQIDSDPSFKPKWIGVLAGSSITPKLADKLTSGYTTPSGVPIAALTIQRFRNTSNGTVYVTTDTYFKSRQSNRDLTKYKFDGQIHGKGRLVLAVVKDYVKRNPGITYAELEGVFPQTGDGSRKDVFATVETANRIYSTTNRARHFLKADELIKLRDATIAVSNQWGPKSIARFMADAEKAYINITQVTS